MESINKGALGIRYLIKYGLDGTKDSFKVVKDCLMEVKLWILITFLANNNDYLGDLIPDYILANFFQKELIDLILKNNQKIDYGVGYYAKTNLSYEEQFKCIRNALAHGSFSFKNGIIKIDIKNYQASFDIKWLEALVIVTLSNKTYNLEKGMYDYSIIATVPNLTDDYDQFLKYIETGLVGFYKITALTGNKEKVKNSMPQVELKLEECSFDLLQQVVRDVLKQVHLKSNSGYDGLKEQRELKFKLLEKALNNCVKLDFVKIDLNNEIFQNKDFQNLSFESRLRYLINNLKYDTRYLYNTIVINTLLENLEYIKNDKEISLEDLMMLKDCLNFLIKVYANILFETGLVGNKTNLLKEYPINVKFVHAKVIYKSYIKAIEKYYRELLDHDGSKNDITEALNLLKQYTLNLENAQDDKCLLNVWWYLRNAIIHDQVEFKGEDIRFYLVGNTLKLKHYSKKTNSWIPKEFSNKQPIWELSMKKKDFLSLLDKLYESLGIEVQVNISKYTHRKNYLH